MATDSIQPVNIDKLLLDQENPRLPEELQGSGEEDILRYMYGHGVLEELAESLLDNGFFPSEPLTVMKKGQRFVVLEGNRRLATLLFLHGDRAPSDLRLDVISTKSQLTKLHEVPCHVVGSRSKVDAVIGFRHIGGLKKWGSEAKARYIQTHIDQLATGDCDDPFRELGRRVGSNAQGMRNPYIAIAVLHAARKSGIKEANQIISERRFGVWQRALNSSDIREFISLGRSPTYEAIREAVKNMDFDALRLVVRDFVTRGTARPLLSDSRDITVYGQILQDERAYKVLRARDDLELAKQIVAQVALPQRVRDLISRVKIVREDLEEADDLSEEVGDAVNELFKIVRAMRSYAQSMSND